jgi:hypothetical protein
LRIIKPPLHPPNLRQSSALSPVPKTPRAPSMRLSSVAWVGNLFPANGRGANLEYFSEWCRVLGAPPSPRLCFCG